VEGVIVVVQASSLLVQVPQARCLHHKVEN
jgi:hypothetical protein